MLNSLVHLLLSAQGLYHGFASDPANGTSDFTVPVIHNWNSTYNAMTPYHRLSIPQGPRYASEDLATFTDIVKAASPVAINLFHESNANGYQADHLKEWSPANLVAVNSSAPAFIGPLATPAQLHDSAPTHEDNHPRVPFTFVCQGWVAVSASRLVSGVCIRIDATTRRTHRGFSRQCYDGRCIVVIPTPVLVGMISVPSSHRGTTSIDWPHPTVFLPVTLVALTTTTELKNAAIVEEPSKQTAPSFAVVVYSPPATNVVRSSQGGVAISRTSGSLPMQTMF